MNVIVPDIQWTKIKRLVILTGAGISAGSGLPTYRGKDGVWGDHQVSQLSRADTLATHPNEHWAFWTSFRQRIASAQPNLGHLAIARLTTFLGEQAVHVVTQNVDGLHQRAGSPRVHELHGTLNQSRCTQCDLPPFDDQHISDTAPPCPQCGAPLRVNVVLFGEHPSADAERKTKIALRDCDLFIAIGTSGSVWPASNFVRGADYAGAYTMLVNLERPEPHNPYFHDIVIGRAEEILPQLFNVEPK